MRHPESAMKLGAGVDPVETFAEKKKKQVPRSRAADVKAA
jgi:hypothetical protein